MAKKKSRKGRPHKSKIRKSIKAHMRKKTGLKKTKNRNRYRNRYRNRSNSLHHNKRYKPLYMSTIENLAGSPNNSESGEWSDMFNNMLKKVGLYRPDKRDREMIDYSKIDRAKLSKKMQLALRDTDPDHHEKLRFLKDAKLRTLPRTKSKSKSRSKSPKPVSRLRATAKEFIPKANINTRPMSYLNNQSNEDNQGYLDNQDKYGIRNFLYI